VIQLSGSVRRWRSVATFTSAIAAALVALIGIQLFQPDWLPEGMRPAPRTQRVEARAPAAPAPSAQYVAVLQKDGGSPAFILTVDGATRNFTVRKVGAAADPGKSFELWADLGQATAAALTGRDRRRRLHRACGAGVLRYRHRQCGDLCGDGRAGRRLAGRQPAFGTGLYRQTGRGRSVGRAAACTGPLSAACIAAKYPPKSENARGERAFSVVDLGVVTWGSYLG